MNVYHQESIRIDSSTRVIQLSPRRLEVTNGWRLEVLANLWMVHSFVDLHQGWFLYGHKTTVAIHGQVNIPTKAILFTYGMHPSDVEGCNPQPSCSSLIQFGLHSIWLVVTTHPKHRTPSTNYPKYWEQKKKHAQHHQPAMDHGSSPPVSRGEKCSKLASESYSLIG